jgi:hypothetical protein
LSEGLKWSKYLPSKYEALSSNPSAAKKNPRHLNNEGQECSTGLVKGRVVAGGGRKRIKEGKYG